MSPLDRLVALYAAIEALPTLQVTFGHGHEVCPATIMRYKVLTLIQAEIAACQADAER